MVPPLIVIVGPTAVGKSGVAILVAQRIGADIVSADSRQIYYGMEIGTGAVVGDDRGGIAHHLMSTTMPEYEVSAGDWAKQAQSCIDQIRGEGKRAIVVGGSGLYIRALLEGLSPIPPIEPSFLREVSARVEQAGMVEMIAQLRVVDPAYAEKVGLRDRKRLVRALAVYESTGKSFTEWHKQSAGKQPTALLFGLSRPRAELIARIAERTDAMLKEGWMEELERLISHYGISNLPRSVKEAVGYKELLAVRQGEMSMADARELIIIRTRQFAKRQMTWFRANPAIEWMECSGQEAIRQWVDWITTKVTEDGAH